LKNMATPSLTLGAASAFFITFGGRRPMDTP
jgi:hypothetical protein